MTQPQLVRLDHHGDIAVMVIDNPPVNALSPAVAASMRDAVDAFERCAHSRALVVCCVGRTFVAGGDIASFDDPGFSATPLNRTLARMEKLQRPVVAALHGFVLGGGLELAMACHWRVAAPTTWLGLPEIKLGLIPGSLGTQRLPRLVGMAKAHDMISSGESLDARVALACGLIDRVDDADAATAGIAFARRLLQRGEGARATCDGPVDMSGMADGFFARERRLAYEDRSRFPASLAVVDALEAAMASFDRGETVEARLFEMLRRSPESKALRYLFFAQRKSARRTDDEAADPASPYAPTHRAFLGAIAQWERDGVSRIRLAHALRGFGFSTLPAGMAADARSALYLEEPHLIPPLIDAIVDAGARLLEDGLCARSSDIDVAWTRDHGFPRFLGGPMYHADESGLDRVVERLAARGLRPSRLLSELARAGARLSEYRAEARPDSRALARQ